MNINSDEFLPNSFNKESASSKQSPKAVLDPLTAMAIESKQIASPDAKSAPIIQRQPSPLPQAKSSMSPSPPPQVDSLTPEDVPTFDVLVSNPRKVTETINPYTVYRVYTKTDFDEYEGKEHVVDRRFNDFLWLYSALQKNHPAVVIPPAPEKNSIGRFQEDFIKARRHALQKMLNKITRHPRLCKDPDLKLFLCSDRFHLEINERKKEASKSFISMFGEAMSSATSFSKFNEPDEWFGNRFNQVNLLETQLKNLYKSLDYVIKEQKELASSNQHFGECLIGLASLEMNPELAQTFIDFGTVHKRIHDLQTKQSQDEVNEFEMTVDEYIRLLGSVKASFDSRAKSYLNWQSDVSELKRKSLSLEKAENQSKSLPASKLQQLKGEVIDCERKELESKGEFEELSNTLKSELERFDIEKVEDFQVTLHQFLNLMVQNQEEIIILWEKFLANLDGSIFSPDLNNTKNDTETHANNIESPRNLESPVVNNAEFIKNNEIDAGPSTPSPAQAPATLDIPEDETSMIWGSVPLDN
ncbi:Vps5-domain-containing protein [Conidiobolus coronatus NRRL 28638]|uniref:Vps5-domain-containing protein n=1 Tax=Conidiobolus coronatus (strain ATCC 28846 / CBS 209.66 / NRRL 28638) TaxID=796925 RepID=A0A137NV64_CONC2|nr:Vps5-domain-containing protein [Conidiobolus coronatus NRRL 28638]|eukprot:KXN66657.1 Vps5-domain-containing protein [Conidiobolus coronatus NRRL 28638]